MNDLIAIFSLFTAAGVPAADMYKCTVDDRTSYQQDPCRDRRPAGAPGIRIDAITPQSSAGAAAGEAISAAKVQSREAAAGKVNREAGGRIKVRDLTADSDALEIRPRALDGGMQSEPNAAPDRKLRAAEIQTGAAWASSMSAQMNAVPAGYSGNLRSLEIEIESLRLQRDRYLPK